MDKVHSIQLQCDSQRKARKRVVEQRQRCVNTHFLINCNQKIVVTQNILQHKKTIQATCEVKNITF